MDSSSAIIEKVVEAIPLERGDCVLVASDISNIILQSTQENTETDIQYYVNSLINLLQEKIGKEGTLCFPTYNWDFCRGIPFHYYKTRSKTGALGQAALKRKDFKRTHHALYSFAVWGRDMDMLYQMNDRNSFVGDTPFAYFHHHNAKMIMLDVLPLRCFTFMHYVEEVCQVDYRFSKSFHGKYIDENNEESERTYSMFVRYLDHRRVETNFEFDAWMQEVGVLSQRTLDNIPIRSLHFNDAYFLIEEDIKKSSARHLIVHT